MLVDTGPLVAAANRHDTHHQACVQALTTARPPRLVPGLVIAEITELASLDRRHLNIVRPRHVQAFTLFPWSRRSRQELLDPGRGSFGR